MIWSRRGLDLGVAGLLLFALSGCKQEPAPPVFGQVPEFQLKDQTGAEVGPGSWDGQVWVAAFMFTRCPSICPKITKTMQDLQRTANREGTKVHWVSFSVDPENDTPEELTRYAQEHGVDASNWSFLTGDVGMVRTTAEAGFKIAVDGKADENSPHYGISHGSHLVLVDKKRQIRGYFRTLDEHAQQKLLATAKRL